MNAEEIFSKETVIFNKRGRRDIEDESFPNMKRLKPQPDLNADDNAEFKVRDIKSKSISNSRKKINSKTFPPSKSKKSQLKEPKSDHKIKIVESARNSNLVKNNLGGQPLISNIFKPVLGKALNADQNIHFHPP